VEQFQALQQRNIAMLQPRILSLAALVAVATLLGSSASAQNQGPPTGSDDAVHYTGNDHAMLGVSLHEGNGPGVGVSTVVPNGPAQMAGVEPGDRILAINGQQVQSYRDLIRILNRTLPGSQLRLQLSRRGLVGELAVRAGNSATFHSQSFAARQPVVPNSFQSQPMPYAAYQPIQTGAPPVNDTGNPWSAEGHGWRTADNGERGAAASYGGGGD
jgi:membrane-associated protease RseP (regulator of RpoE activity)